MIKARVRTGFALRLIFMAALLLFMGLWFFYDAIVRYPHQHATALAWEGYVEAHDGDASAAREQWLEDIRDANSDVHGMSAPTMNRQGTWAAGKKFDDLPAKQREQKIWAFVVLPLGLILSLHIARYYLRWTALAEDGIQANGNATIPFTSIRKLDKTLWDNKGIAHVIYYDDVAGIEKRHVLDDWKYDTLPTRQILEAVEERLSDDQIIGEREAIKRARRAAQEQEKLQAQQPAATADDPPSPSA